MKKQNFIGGGKQPVYAAPTAELVEIRVEQGFQASLYGDEMFPGDGLNDPNNYDIFF